jgi:hypothetical protein
VEYQIVDSPTEKKCISLDYNFIFNKKNGMFLRWGKNYNEDPSFAPFGPEILDIEITTKCQNGNCKECYKSNTSNGQNMSFETFKTIIDKVAKSKILTQVAIGADYDLTANPDLWKMMEYCRSIGIIPNITVGKVTKDSALNLAKYAGAVAISYHNNKDICYDSVKMLTDLGMKQINIHFVIYQDSYNMALQIADDIVKDSRLKELNAMVLLSLKPKGRGANLIQLSQDKFNILVKKLMDLGISYGFDSCSSQKVMNSLVDHPQKHQITQCITPCCATLFSSYINVLGEFSPCSFCEKSNTEFDHSLNVINCSDFLKDIWYNNTTINLRQKMINRQCNNNFECPIYKV